MTSQRKNGEKESTHYRVEDAMPGAAQVGVGGLGMGSSSTACCSPFWLSLCRKLLFARLGKPVRLSKLAGLVDTENTRG